MSFNEPDYEDWSDEELSDQLRTVDEMIQIYQGTLATVRKSLNRRMEEREDLIDIIKQRAKSRKGWKYG